MKNILLTGVPGVGKTTLVRRLSETAPMKFGGFFTGEIREKGKRIGFSISTLDGREGILAHVEFSSPYRVGKYGVRVNDLEDIGVGSIREALADSRVVVIDEIGKMELFSGIFKKETIRALDSDRKVLATIKAGGNPFVNRIKMREDVLLIEVTFGNRDSLVDEIGELLESPV